MCGGQTSIHPGEECPYEALVSRKDRDPEIFGTSGTLNYANRAFLQGQRVYPESPIYVDRDQVTPSQRRTENYQALYNKGTNRVLATTGAIGIPLTLLNPVIGLSVLGATGFAYAISR